MAWTCRRNPQRQAVAKEDLSKALAHHARIPPAHQRLGGMFPGRERSRNFGFTKQDPGIPASRGRIEGMGPGQLKDGRRQRLVPPA